jgi:translation initiation factor IF-3
VLLIDQDGTSIGVVSLFSAMAKAKEASLDLVEISPNTNPPVTKIMDFGRFKYEQEKKDKENKQKSKTLEVKEIRLSAKIGDHDLKVKAEKALELSEKGHKILVSMRLHGRENIFVDRAAQVIKRFADMVNMTLVEEPKKMGNQIRVNLIKNKTTGSVNAKIEDTQNIS